MNTDLEISKWVESISERIKKDSNEYPEFDKLYPLFQTGLFYELFHPLGVAADEGIYGYYKTFRTLAHAWYDDGGAFFCSCRL